MPRWPEDTKQRLVDAAFELFVDRGYAATTVQQIAHRAGTTPRTFFRHFPDKDEVLFADDDELLPLLVGAIGEDAHADDAGAMMRSVLDVLAQAMSPHRERLVERDRIIAQDVGLAGRELAKQARWQRSVAEALHQRGFSDSDAAILAAIGFALFTGALHDWLADPRAELRTLVDERFPRIATALTQPVPPLPEA
ncbi:TetR/AcrR family transcriptional regulator [Microbacterium sp. NPDC057407]|uniref:TetR/AcrR family transcriptional regulator n=1 Tax=Microbacterium sp. NPDC057407 TaxID=3346120 RepID=UPI00366FE832